MSMLQVNARGDITPKTLSTSRPVSSEAICYATRSTALSINNATVTAIPLTTEVYDTANMFTATDSKIFIPVDSIYEVIGFCFFNTNITGYREVTVLTNGLEAATQEGADTVNIGGTAFAVRRIQPMVAGDYVQVGALQFSGGALDVLSASLSVRRVLEDSAGGFINARKDGAGSSIGTFAGIKVVTTTPTAFARNVSTNITFTSTEYNQGGVLSWSAGTPTKVTVNAAGYYRILAQLDWAAGTPLDSSWNTGAIKINTVQTGPFVQWELAGHDQGQFIKHFVHLAVNDTVEIYGNCVHGATGGTMNSAYLCVWPILLD